MGIAVTEQPDDAAVTTRARADTLRAAIAQTVLPAEITAAEMRSHSNVPAFLLHTSLKHAELGTLGNKLYDQHSIAQLMVFHEPHLRSMGRRRMTGTSDSLTARGESFGSLDDHIVETSRQDELPKM